MSAREAAGTRLPQYAFCAIVAVLSLGCAAALWRVVAVLPLHVPLDPNEGWNAYHTAAAMSGHGPYPPAASFMTDNYPPLSFYLVGALGTLVGDNILAGRLISLLSFLVVGSGIAILAKRSGQGTLAAIFAALVFASILLLYSDYVGMDDPQLLGHALQIAALLLLLPNQRTVWSELGAAALFIAALFVKHNLVAMPIAAVIWMGIRDWRHALRLASIMFAVGIAGLVVFRFCFGFDLLSRLNSPRVFSLSLLASNFRDWLIPGGLPLVTSLAAAASRDRFAVFCAIYALVGVAIGVAFLGGAGVDVNAMFDADIAVALGAGMAVERIVVFPGLKFAYAQAALATVVLLPLALGLFPAFDSARLDADFWLHPMRDETELAGRDIAWLQVRKGPAICEMLSLCYWAGKPEAVDVFNLDQQFLTGARETEAFVAMLKAKRFAGIQFDSLSPFPFPTSVELTIRDDYRIDRSNDDGVFLVPASTK